MTKQILIYILSILSFDIAAKDFSCSNWMEKKEALESAKNYQSIIKGNSPKETTTIYETFVKTLGSKEIKSSTFKELKKHGIKDIIEAALMLHYAGGLNKDLIESFASIKNSNQALITYMRLSNRYLLKYCK